MTIIIIKIDGITVTNLFYHVISILIIQHARMNGTWYILFPSFLIVARYFRRRLRKKENILMACIKTKSLYAYHYLMAASTVSRRRLYKKVTSKKLPGGCQNKELTIFKEILLDLNNVEEFYFCNYLTPCLSFLIWCYTFS